MARKIGFTGPEDQGYFDGRRQPDKANPYPTGSQAWREWAGGNSDGRLGLLHPDARRSAPA